jgi:hypothetical protein
MRKDKNVDLQFHILYIPTAPALQAVRPPQFNGKPLLHILDMRRTRRRVRVADAFSAKKPGKIESVDGETR